MAGEQNPAVHQLNFVKTACEVAKIDLTDFFDKYGFFYVGTLEYDDYGKYTYTISYKTFTFLLHDTAFPADQSECLAYFGIFWLRFETCSDPNRALKVCECRCWHGSTGLLLLFCRVRLGLTTDSPRKEYGFMPKLFQPGYEAALTGSRMRTVGYDI